MLEEQYKSKKKRKREGRRRKRTQGLVLHTIRMWRTLIVANHTFGCCSLYCPSKTIRKVNAAEKNILKFETVKEKKETKKKRGKAGEQTCTSSTIRITRYLVHVTDKNQI